MLQHYDLQDGMVVNDDGNTGDDNVTLQCNALKMRVSTTVH